MIFNKISIRLIQSAIFLWLIPAQTFGQAVTKTEYLKVHAVPSIEFLCGEWHYDDNAWIFFKGSGDTPSKGTADRHLSLMNVNSASCELIFFDGHTCSFRVGNKKFKLEWELDPQTREFRARVPFFSIKGYLVQDGDRLALIYSKADLFLMMRFLCPLSTHKYIKELSAAMDITDGLTMAILFKK